MSQAEIQGDKKAAEHMIGRLTGEAEALEDFGRHDEAQDKLKEAAYYQGKFDALKELANT